MTWAIVVVVAVAVALIAIVITWLVANGQYQKSSHGRQQRIGVFEERGKTNTTIVSESKERIASLEAQVQEGVEFKTLASEREKAPAEERSRSIRLEGRLAQAEAESSTLRGQIETERKLLEENYNKMKADFQVLAQTILESTTAKFTATNQEKLQQIIEPFSKDLGEFKRRVEETYTEETKQRSSLEEKIRSLAETTVGVTKTAEDLANALKGSVKAQGAWGEMVLEKVFESSGRRECEEYELQKSLRAEDKKRYPPDAVVHLPESRDAVVDAKVSLLSYEQYTAASNEPERYAAQKALAVSLRAHMKGLAEKRYQKLEGVQTLDFVLMFIPAEGSLPVALPYDNQLVLDGFQNGIIIATPTTLMLALRTIENAWRFERQNQNVQKIFKSATALYDKFVSFVGALENVGKRLDQAQDAWRDANDKLREGRGNLIGRAEELKELGVISSKTLEIEDDISNLGEVEDLGDV